MSKINLSPEDISNWVKQYNTLNTLPSPKIPCSCCKEAVTMFSTNLHGRVKKFGGVENLLKSFLCRHCKKEDKKNIFIDRKVKIKTAKGNVIDSIPTVDYKPRVVVEGKDLPKHKDLIAELTNGTCWYPNVYLNNNKVCDKCTIHESCKATSKKYSKNRSFAVYK